MYTGSCGYAYECNKWITGCGNCPQLWNATKSYRFDRTHSAWIRMKNAFDGFDTLKIISVSQWVKSRAKRSPIMQSYDIDVVENGIDTEETFYSRDFQYLKEKYGLKNEKILLHVTANFSMREDDRKGGSYVVKLAERLKRENIKFIVVGGRDLTIPLPDNIINVGRINNQKEQAEYYSMADLTVLTSKRETFSMPCAESLACGTPVVGFKAGGPESIALKKYSAFVEYGDLYSLERTVIEWINVKSSLTPNTITYIANQVYSRKKMNLEYIKTYNQLQ